MTLVACFAQNIDRVVTVYRVAKQTGRTLIVDAYAAEELQASRYDSIPKIEEAWNNIAVYIPQSQRVSLKRKGMASIVDGYRGFRLWPEQLSELASSSVMLFRGRMLQDLERANTLAGARVFWSQWDGYLKDGAGHKLKQECFVRDIPFYFASHFWARKSERPQAACGCRCAATPNSNPHVRAAPLS